MKNLLSSLSLLFMLSACAFITGREPPPLPEGRRPVQLQFVETLKNEASLQGQSFREITPPGDPATNLQLPNAVFADAFRVYVTDTYTSTSIPTARLFIFDRGAQTVTVFDGTPPPQYDQVALIAPTGIAVDAANVIFVSDFQQGRVFGYQLNGTLIKVLGRGGALGAPSGLAVDRQRNLLFVADKNARQVRVFNTLGVWRFDLFAADAAAAPAPTAIAFDRSNDLYILDARAQRVHVLDPAGSLIRAFSIRTETPGLPTRPEGIAVDSDGHVYVTDAAANTVLIFDRDGAFLHTWGRAGRLFGEFSTPAGIFIDERNYVYIADRINGRVQVFQYVRFPAP